MTAWKLPEHLADILPRKAKQIEHLRRTLLDTVALYGYELVQPPALEYLDALLTGSGKNLTLRTFKLVDQLSGRTLGLRADTTPQVARIDAHLLHHNELSRLCYCGSVFHTKPARASASREQLQFGAEIYGHDGIEADWEILNVAIACLQKAGMQSSLLVDIGNARMVSDVLDAADLVDEQRHLAQEALAAKNQEALVAVLDTNGVEDALREQILQLLQAHGGVEVLDELLAQDAWQSAAAELTLMRDVAQHIQTQFANVRVGIDLADTQGYSYYSGLRFAVYTPQLNHPVLRGGRYDGVGAAFKSDQKGRPAVGFSLDLKTLAYACNPVAEQQRIVATLWQAHAQHAAAQKQAIEALREQGEIVACVYTQEQLDSGAYTNELVLEGDEWVVVARPSSVGSVNSVGSV